ncbi:MAG: D-alanyl-D-alanine carboxypeptidase family protein [Bacillota bacterium]
MYKRQFIALFLMVILLSTMLPAPVLAEPEKGLSLDVEGAILIEASTGQVLYEEDADKKWPPASVTKLMTLTMVMEAVADGRANLTDPVRTSEHAAGHGGSQVWLEVGEERTLHDMLIAVSLGSANDASVAVAEHMAGSEEAFVEEMNKKAKELGLTNTHFANPHGLPQEDHYTSARDLAKISQYALRFPEILKFSSMKYFKFREEPLLELWNLNKLLWWFPGADGFKTGTTIEAKRCLASTAERGGLRLIGVVLGADKPKGHFAESIKLLNYGFARYGFKQFYQQGDAVGSLQVGKGQTGEVRALAGAKVGAMLLKGKDQEKGLEAKVVLPPTVEAPVIKGQKLGEVIVSKDGQELTRVDLLAEADVLRFTLGQSMSKIMRGIVSPD